MRRTRGGNRLASFGRATASRGQCLATSWQGLATFGNFLATSDLVVSQYVAGSGNIFLA
jgi:hypothetical protein